MIDCFLPFMQLLKDPDIRPDKVSRVMRKARTLKPVDGLGK